MNSERIRNEVRSVRLEKDERTLQEQGGRNTNRELGKRQRAFLIYGKKGGVINEKIREIGRAQHLT